MTAPAYVMNKPTGTSDALQYLYPVGVEMIWSNSGWSPDLHQQKPLRIALSNTLVPIALAHGYDRVHIRSMNHATTTHLGAQVPCPPHITVNFQGPTQRGATHQFVPAHVFVQANLTLTNPAPPADAANGLDGTNPQFFAAMNVRRDDGSYADATFVPAPKVPPPVGTAWTL